ncbi:MAG: serine/threonine protein kinase [Steroidobacterales bacterium]
MNHTEPTARTAPDDAERPFAALTPDAVLHAAERIGLEPDGRLFALNSYENRVYRVGRHDADAVVLKFYRAGRWSDAQILEEHAFATELAAQEIPVAAPLVLHGTTLNVQGELRVAAFPMRSGAAPELDRPEARELLGRTLGRIHSVGAVRPFRLRPTQSGARLGAAARTALLRSQFLPEHVQPRYERVSGELLLAIESAFAAAAPIAHIRVHGDCHLGNILWTPQGPVFVDLDDCMNAPRIQDLWMFLSGNADEQRRQWLDLMEGYLRFSNLDSRELGLIEPLRAARMLNHAAWVAERWRDPAFPRAFPWMGEARFWEQYTNDLAEQCTLLAEPPLSSLC